MSKVQWIIPLLLMVICVFVQLAASQNNCFCAQPLWLTPGACIATPPGLVCANATRVTYGWCGQTQCFRRDRCLDINSCTYSWGPWSAYSSCDVHCVKRRSRDCLREGTTVSVGCAGGSGQSVQYRSCAGDGCVISTTIASTASSSSSVFSSTSTGVTARTLSTRAGGTPHFSSGSTSTTKGVEGTASPVNETKATSTAPAPPPAVGLSRDIILLIAILGAAFMLSIAIIVVACLFCRKRKKSDFQAENSFLNQRPLPTAVGNSTYEVVGPPQRSPPPTPNRSAPSSQPRMVENRLYEMTHLDASNSFRQNGGDELSTTSDGYLRPISPPNTQDSVYAQPGRPAAAQDNTD